MSPIAVALGVVALVGVLSTWFVVSRSMHQLPATVAHHFDFLGRPDAWGRKQLLWGLPAIVTVLLIVIPSLALWGFSKNAATTDRTDRDFEYLALVLAYMAWMFYAITKQTVDVGLGKRQSLRKGTVLVILATLALVILAGSIYLR